MSNFVDYSGQKFGRLTVLSRAENKNGRTMFNCVCECGNKKAIWIESLKNGSTKSCGCLSREIVAAKNYRHGQRNTRLYRIWLTMKSRCYLPSQVGYKYYGGQGVTVCDEWKNDFMSFHDWAMNNGYEETLTIDRIDPYGNYEPSNCRWSTVKEQCNNRSSNINITIGNATKSLMSWCEIFNVDYKKVHARYQRNGYESIDRLFNDIL